MYARKELLKWSKARALRKFNALNVAKFIYKQIACRFGVLEEIVFNGGLENLEEVKQLIRRLGVKYIKISAYNPRANGLVKGGYKPVLAILRKLKDARSKN